MKRYPIKEIKDLENEIFRTNILNDIDLSKIKNYSQVQILKYLLEAREKNIEVYQKDFLKVLNIRKSTISGILNTMEKNKIISRVHMPRCSKGNLVTFTKEASTCMNSLMIRIEEAENKLTNGIDEQDLEIFYKVIDKMKENLKRRDDN